MPQQGANLVQVNTGGEQQRRRGVAQVVNAGVRDFRRIRVAADLDTSAVASNSEYV
ncbi:MULTISPECIES: hypothetical protein [unclassified Parafrankia]|uniref:hypothetical protein n=1 Tax=unclassified Parafrankia TaxID=2994368 RepID=UPI001F325097|nr:MULTISPECIES: hypothetical protein [unclassified Parafrankia]